MDTAIILIHKLVVNRRIDPRRYDGIHELLENRQ
jgi:hypothetical protein